MGSIPPIANWVIYTDLDGTLLDHHSYSHTAAQPALDWLHQHSVPVVLTSSKTFPELEALAAQLHLEYPVIGENGAFVAWPVAFDLAADGGNEKRGYHFSYFGKSSGEIASVLQTLRGNPEFQFSGFSDWSVEDLMQKTGLSENAAIMAKQREASEPILWQGRDGALQDFRAALEAQGLKLVRGGRFYHVMGPTSKRRAMEWLNAALKKQRGSTPFTIALGDGPNDLEMLEAADVSVIVANPFSDAVEPQARRLIRTQATGPAGWNEAIQQIRNEGSMHE